MTDTPRRRTEPPAPSAPATPAPGDGRETRKHRDAGASDLADGSREGKVLDAVVSMVDRLLDDFDVVELLTELTERCSELLDVATAGLLLASPPGRLHLMTATSARTTELELLQLQTDEGPCLDCYATGRPQSVADLTVSAERWPRFAAAAVEAGFASVHAVPMRAASTVIGALGLFGTTPGDLNPADRTVAQALAHVATVAIVQHHAPTAQAVIPRLQQALAAQVAVEQAKGFLRQRLGVDIAEGGTLLRQRAADTSEHLTELARRIVAERPPAAELAALFGVADLSADS